MGGGWTGGLEGGAFPGTGRGARATAVGSQGWRCPNTHHFELVSSWAIEQVPMNYCSCFVHQLFNMLSMVAIFGILKDHCVNVHTFKLLLHNYPNAHEILICHNVKLIIESVEKNI